MAEQQFDKQDRTSAQAAFREWWSSHEITAKRQGLEPDSAWFVWRAAWHALPSATRSAGGTMMERSRIRDAEALDRVFVGVGLCPHCGGDIANETVAPSAIVPTKIGVESSVNEQDACWRKGWNACVDAMLNPSGQRNAHG